MVFPVQPLPQPLVQLNHPLQAAVIGRHLLAQHPLRLHTGVRGGAAVEHRGQLDRGLLVRKLRQLIPQGLVGILQLAQRLLPHGDEHLQTDLVVPVDRLPNLLGQVLQLIEQVARAFHLHQGIHYRLFGHTCPPALLASAAAATASCMAVFCASRKESRSSPTMVFTRSSSVLFRPALTRLSS